MSENNFWVYLREKMRGRWQHQRHEDKFAKGIPDVMCVVANNTNWIELKYVEVDTKDNINIKIYPEQVRWLQKFWKAGVPTWVLVRVKEQNGKTHHWLMEGRFADKVGGKQAYSTFASWADSLEIYSEPWIEVLVSKLEPY